MTNETKAELFVRFVSGYSMSGIKLTQGFIKRTPNQLKHCGGNKMVWGFFAASGPG